MSSDPEGLMMPFGFAVIGFSLVLILTWQFTRWTEWTVDLQVENAGNLKWYVDSGSGFSEREGAYAPVPAGEWESVSVLLPTGAPRSLRLDPVETEGNVFLRGIRWREPWPGGSGVLDPEDAAWSGVSKTSGDSGNVWILEPSEGVPDIAGVWKVPTGHSPFWWWTVRFAFATGCAGVLLFGGYAWNRRILRATKAHV